MLIALGLAACGSTTPSSAPTGASTPAPTGASTPAPSGAASIRTGAVQPVTFEELKTAVEAYYAAHPEADGYIGPDELFELPKAVRDHDLTLCQLGNTTSGTDPATIQSKRILGCLPLIYGFYVFGRSHSSADLVDLARKTYAYAVTNITGPSDTRAALNSTLANWGVP